jgi:carboxyl-terminal processing protease
VAAAILENARGDVVGGKTFGVGSVQQTLPMQDGAALLLSVAKFYTPGGKAIQDTAITPNILVNGDDDIAALDDDSTPEGAETPGNERPQKPKQDLQLQRALDVLKNRKAAAA